MLFILSPGRSGSNLMSACLNQIDGVRIMPEIFAPYNYRKESSYENAKSRLRGRAKSPRFSGGIVGCKVLYHHIIGQGSNREDLLALIFKDGNTILDLNRRNITEWVISAVLSDLHQNWGSYGKLVTGPVQLDIGSVKWQYERFLAQRELRKELSLRYPDRIKEIYYEDFIKDKRGTVESIASLISVEPPQVLIEDLLKKQASAALYNRITNLKEVEQICGMPVDCC